MTTSTFALTVAIPTYNRKAYLAELLPVLMVEIGTLPPGIVELLVIDNASTDKTSEYLSGLNASFLVKRCNLDNIGGDRNFIECVRQSRGRYLWLFGDDELFIPGSLARICAELQNAPALLIVESDFEQQFRATCYADLLRRVLWHDPVFLVHHTLITKNIFPRAGFDTDFATRKLATSYAHMYGLLSHLCQTGAVVLFSRDESAFRVREQRAPFDQVPQNLERKLVRLARDFAAALRFPGMFWAVLLYYQAEPLYNLVFCKRVRRWRQRRQACI